MVELPGQKFYKNYKVSLRHLVWLSENVFECSWNINWFEVVDNK